MRLALTTSAYDLGGSLESNSFLKVGTKTGALGLRKLLADEKLTEDEGELVKELLLLFDELADADEISETFQKKFEVIDGSNFLK